MCDVILTFANCSPNLYIKYVPQNTTFMTNNVAHKNTLNNVMFRFGHYHQIAHAKKWCS